MRASASPAAILGPGTGIGGRHLDLPPLLNFECAAEPFPTCLVQCAHPQRCASEINVRILYPSQQMQPTRSLDSHSASFYIGLHAIAYPRLHTSVCVMRLSINRQRIRLRERYDRRRRQHQLSANPNLLSQVSQFSISRVERVTTTSKLPSIGCIIHTQYATGKNLLAASAVPQFSENKVPVLLFLSFALPHRSKLESSTLFSPSGHLQSPHRDDVPQRLCLKAGRMIAALRVLRLGERTLLQLRSRTLRERKVRKQDRLPITSHVAGHTLSSLLSLYLRKLP